MMFLLLQTVDIAKLEVNEINVTPKFWVLFLASRFIVWNLYPSMRQPENLFVILFSPLKNSLIWYDTSSFKARVLNHSLNSELWVLAFNYFPFLVCILTLSSKSLQKNINIWSVITTSLYDDKKDKELLLYLM